MSPVSTRVRVPACAAGGGALSARASRTVETGRLETFGPFTRITPRLLPFATTLTRYAVADGVSETAGVIAENDALGPKRDESGFVPATMSCLLATITSPPTNEPLLW